MLHDVDIGVPQRPLRGERLGYHVLGYIGRLVLQGGPTEDNFMPKMSDSRRKRIQAKQRKATNALERAAKVAKRKRNSAKPGTAAG